MKRIVIVLLVSAAALVGAANAAPPVDLPAGGGFFYSSLSPYGEWFQSDFGYAWRPSHVVHGWRPYLYGQWVWTDYGWYWASSEPFGWATFHYGRWHYDDYYGWIWIPDETWGPAWVEWRYDDDYIGWAPLSPAATFSFSAGLAYTHSWRAPVHYWNFVQCRYFTSTRIYDNVQPVERVRRIFGNTRVAENIRVQDNRVVNRGVDVNFVSRRTNTQVRRVEVVDGDRSRGDRIVRGDSRERLEVYRPRIEGDARKGEAVRPDNMGRQVTPPSRKPGRDVLRTPPGRETQKPDNPINRQREQLRLEKDRMQLQQEQQARRQNENRTRLQQQPQRQPDQRMRQRETPKIEKQPQRMQERQQPQRNERPRPAQRPAEPRGGREGKRRS